MVSQGAARVESRCLLSLPSSNLLATSPLFDFFCYFILVVSVVFVVVIVVVVAIIVLVIRVVVFIAVCLWVLVRIRR